MDWLLAQGANPNALSTLDETALSFAIREGTMKVVKRLIAVGTDASRGSLLPCASEKEPSDDTKSLIDMLICNGARVDTYEYDGVILRYGYKWGTALHTACEERNFLAAEALLEHGADPLCPMKQAEKLLPPTPLELVSTVPHLRALLERYIK